MSKSISRALLRSSSLIIFISSSVTLSSAAFANDPLQVVVTADRSEVPLKNTGSAITVITSEEIEKYGSKNIADVLRTVPGVTVAEAGGLGTASKVSLRGASPGASMVLLDGIRIGDPSNTEGFLDFGNFSAANIERIEIVRGPQSALYGSDAMGGVINIITKKGTRAPVREVTLEGGSYGTISARGSMSGTTDKVSYSFGVNALHSDGFPRYGYRVPASSRYPLYPYLSPADQTSPNPMNDPVDKTGVNGNVTFRVNDDMSISTGLSYYGNAIQFDNAEAYDPANVYNENNHSKAAILNGYIKSQFSSFDGALNSQITFFGNQTKLDNWQMELDYMSRTDANLPWYSGYVGKRIGAEYTGDLNLAVLGPVLIGLRRETELAVSSQDPADGYYATDESQTTNSIFVQKRLKLNERLDVSLTGRTDAIESSSNFPTWRSTFAYQLDELKAKLRGAIGTGAKAPSLLQRFSLYGTPDLLPEHSFGYELGIDKEVVAGLNFSATAFSEEFTDRIGYGNSCRNYGGTPPWQCYYNIKNSQSKGFEIEASFDVIPDKWRARASYTFVDAIDVDLQKQLYRTPRDTASLSLTYLGLPKWEFEPRLTYVGERLDVYFYSDFYDLVGGFPKFKSADITLPSYLKLDFLTRYNLNSSNDAYIRFENLTDAQTADIYNYGSAGRSVYVGWTTRF